jgi:hypothetical protein
MLPAWALVSEAARRRARSQGLHRPRPDAVRRLLALQAQDPRAAALALRVRGASTDGLVVTWLMRGTLHLVHRDDVGWLHELFAPPQLGANARRLGQEGVSEMQAARAVELIGAAVSRAPSSRSELATVLSAEGIPVAGQAIVHLLAKAAFEGVTMLTVDRRFIPLAPGVAVGDPLAELGRRYLAAHADAGPEDLAYWSGLPLREARAACGEPPEFGDGPVGVRLLGAFDELLLGWRDRTPAVAAAHARAVHPGGGILRPVVLEDGEARGTWGLRAGRVTLDLWAPVADDAALDAEIAAVSAA